MVNDAGQLYTIEGVAAAALMIFTAYLVLSSTNLYTQGDTHISDMQLEQLGNDVLKIMDTPPTEREPSSLEIYAKDLNYFNNGTFKNTFVSYADRTTGWRMDNIKINASISYSNGTTQYFTSNDQYYRENAVKVSRLIRVDNSPPQRNQTVLLEVLLWR
jgi:hypothetical protein